MRIFVYPLEYTELMFTPYIFRRLNTPIGRIKHPTMKWSDSEWIYINKDVIHII